MSNTDVRLVDANRFKRFLQALCKAGAPYDEVIQLLDKEPTAYDVEKVIAELEERTFEADVIMPLGDVMKNRKLIESGNANDIVRKGGVK